MQLDDRKILSNIQNLQTNAKPLLSGTTKSGETLTGTIRMVDAVRLERLQGFQNSSLNLHVPAASRQPQFRIGSCGRPINIGFGQFSQKNAYSLWCGSQIPLELFAIDL